MTIVHGIEALARDIRYACRAIARMPGLAAVVIVSLGIGIGVNTAVFTWLQYMVFQPLPRVANSGALHLVEPRSDTGGYPGVSWLEYRDLRERTQSFQDLFAARMVPFSVGDASRVERTVGQLVSANYFSALDLQPALGRFLRPEEAEQIGREPVAVISYDLWQSRYGGDANVVGRTIHVNRHELTIVGVAPDGFQGNHMGIQFDLWVPATLAQLLIAGSRELEDRDSRGYGVMGHLRDGVTSAQAQEEITRVMQDLAREYPASNATIMRAEILSYWQTPRGPQRMFVSALGILQTIMLIVLVTICGNTATLMLTRASERQREMGVRLAIGAGRWRLVRAVLTENVVLALLGALLGAVVAVWTTEAIRTIDLPANLPLRFLTRVDAVGFAFAGALGLFCGLIFGAAPALHLARLDPQRAIRAGSPLAGPGRLRSALIGAEVALALVVLVVATLFVRSFVSTRSTDTGFKREGLLLATYDLTGRDEDQRMFAARVLDQLNRIPSVEAALSMSVPLDIHGLPLRTFTLEGRARPDGRLDRAASNTVTPGYFQTMKIPFRAGTDFADLRDASAPAQTIVNDAFVQQYLGDAEPLGRRVQSGSRTYTIVGVVATSTSDAFGEPPTPAIYFSYRDRPAPLAEMHLRTRDGAEAALAPEVRRVLREIDSSLPIYNVRTMTAHIDKNLVMRRIPAQLFMVLGPMLLALASIGIYGVVGHIVASRTAEIGVRQALGATRGRVVAEIVMQSLRAVVVGALAGWVIAGLIAFDLLRNGINAVPVLIGVPAILLTVAAVACWLPARRATKIDPATALRVR